MKFPRIRPTFENSILLVIVVVLACFGALFFLTMNGEKARALAAEGASALFEIDEVTHDQLYIVRAKLEHFASVDVTTKLSMGLVTLGKTHIIDALEHPILIDNTTWGFVVRVHPKEVAQQ